MSRGRTLWEMFTDWVAGPHELKHFNPLKAQIGHSVSIDDIDWRDRDFKVREVRQYKRTVGGRQFLFVDYVLTERTVQGVETDIRVRLNPAAGVERGGEEFHALLLVLEDEMTYDQGFHDVVRDPSGLFRIEHDGQVEAEFTRLHSLTEPYRAQVTILADQDSNRKVTKDEIESVQIDYWDFERDTTDAAGQAVKEYLFIEMNASDGWFQIWRGSAIDPNAIAVL